MSNQLSDLNNHLFATLDRLGNEDLSNKELAREIDRAGAITKVAQEITTITGQQLRAVELTAKHGDRHRKSLPMLTEPDPIPAAAAHPAPVK